jgi:hypothetical protein
MTGADHPSDVGPIVYVDRSDVHQGCLNELKVGIHALVAFVDAHQPQMAMYGIYLDEQAHRMTVVSVHPNSTSLERHIKLGAPEFRKLAPYVDLREIEVFGQLSEAAADLVRKKAAALGDGGRITLHERSAGFGRLCVPPTV